MPAAEHHPQSVAAVKAHFGFAQGTRYASIKKKKNEKLNKYLPSINPTPAQIRTLFEQLSRETPQQWSARVRRTAKEREAERLEQQRITDAARRLALAERRRRTIAKRDGTPPAAPESPAPRPPRPPRSQKQVDAWLKTRAKAAEKRRKLARARAPPKPRYRVTCDVGATYEHVSAEGDTVLYTINRMTNIITNDHVERELGSNKNTLPFVREAIQNIVPYTTVDHGSRGREGATTMVAYRLTGAMDDILYKQIPYSAYARRLVDFWLNAPPTVDVAESTPTQTLANEPMRRASVLRQCFVKHVGGIDQAAYESAGQCVIHQLLSVLLEPRYTLPITSIPSAPGADDLVPLTWYSLRRYFGVLNDDLLQRVDARQPVDRIAAYEEAELVTPGITPNQVAMLCNDLRLNMYALDYKSRAFTRITAYSNTTPRGQSSAGFDRNECCDHHPLVYYTMNEHMYLITHKQTIKSIVESCKDNDSHGSKRTENEVEDNELPYVTDHGMSVVDILQGDVSACFVIEADDLTPQLQEYMRLTNDNPRITTKNGRTVGFAITKVKPPPSVRPRPKKPLRRDYPRRSGDEDYHAAMASFQEDMQGYKQERAAFTDAPVSKRKTSLKFVVNPNHAEDVRANVTRAFCEHAGLKFTNQALGKLSLQLAHPSRDHLSASLRKRVFDEQQGKCAACEAPIDLAADAKTAPACELDHTIPLHAGGTNCRGNLALLCITCHEQKTSAERHGGFKRTPQYHSSFAPSVIEQILPQTKTWAFSELLERDEDGEAVYRAPEQCFGADMNASYPSTLRYHETPWPKFCSLDTPHPYDGGDIVKGAMYKIVTKATMPFHGSGYYDCALAQFGLQNGIISKSDIVEAWLPYETLPPGFIAQYQDSIDAHFVDLNALPHDEKPAKFAKRLQCSLIGCMELVDAETEWCAATLSPATAADMVTSHGDDEVMLTKPFAPRVQPRHTVTQLHQIVARTSPRDLENPVLFEDVLRKHAKRLGGAPWVAACVDQLLQHHTFADGGIQLDVRDIVPAEAVDRLTKVYNAAVAELDSLITPRDREVIVKRIDDLMEEDRAAVKASELDQIYVAHHRREVKSITSACLIRRCTIQRANLEMYKLCQQVRAIDGVLRWIKTDYLAWWLPNTKKTIDLTTLKWDGTDVEKFKPEPLLSLQFESMPRYVRDAAPAFQPPVLTTNSSYDGSNTRDFILQHVYTPRKSVMLDGPPGTGKTFATNTLIDILEANDDKFIACSTSHVSKNLMGNESSLLRDENADEAANTIHSEYLRYNRDPQMYLAKLQKRGVEWFIVDEVGMMPSQFYDFLCHLRRVIPGLCVVLVGDYMQLTPVKDPWFVNLDKTCFYKTAAFADITGGNIIKFSRYMRGDRDDPQGGKAVFDTFMRFNRFIQTHGTKEVSAHHHMLPTLDMISQDIPATFPVTSETTVNIAYTHATRKAINQYYMDKYAALASEVVNLPAPTDTDEQKKKCQDVKLFRGVPLIAVKTVKTLQVYNAEMFDVVDFPRPKAGWRSWTLTQLKDLAQKMFVSTAGKKAEIIERIEKKEAACVIRNRRSGKEIHVPLERFHALFRVAYCITVHQSQGQTIREKYTIFDWNLPFLKDEERARARYVALSRGTRKDHVQIDTSDADDVVLERFIKQVVLNDAFVGEKPDFNEFAVSHQLNPVIFKYRYEAMMAKIVAQRDAAEDKFIVSLHEPIDGERMERTITYIEERMHKLAPVGESREHDKVREVLDFLVGLRERPERVEYVYMGAIGRLYTSDTRGNARSRSLQGCFNGLRARLIGHVGHDIDIANSLPSLTVQWIHKLARLDESVFAESDVTWLAHYVENRAQWLNDLTAHYKCDRSAAKALLLSAMFGGKPENHYEELGIKPRDTFRPLQKVVEELRALRPKVIGHMNTLPKYKALYDLKLEQKGSVAAAERSVFALITQEIEDHVMRVIRKYLHERGVEIFSLIHDGFIAAECNEQLLRDIEAHVAEYGWTIKLAEKPLYGLQDEPVPELAPLYDSKTE